MKKLFIFVSVFAIFLTGCGLKEENNWQNASDFGDINVEATEVDRNDFDTKLDIDKYLTLSELNENDKNFLVNDNYRLFYNKIANQLDDLPLLVTYDANIEETGSYIVYDCSKDEIGNYLYNDEGGYMISIKSEIPFSSDDDEAYHHSLAKVMAPIYGGIPYLKKYDLNRIFLELENAFQEDKKSYSEEINGLSLTVKKDYNYVTVYITGYR